MKQYIYKMQWLCSPKTAYKIIKAIGARSLTKITLRDRDSKILDNYSGMVQYPYGVADDETIKYIKKQLKNDKRITQVELLRFQ